MDLSVAKYSYNLGFLGVHKKFSDKYLSEKLIPYIESNTPVEQVMSDMKVCIKTLDAWAKRYYDKTFRQLYNTEMNKTVMQEILALQQSSVSVKDIAKEMGRSLYWIKKRMKDFSIPKKIEERRKIFEQAVPLFINKGYNLEQMSKELNEPKYSISRWIKMKYGKSFIQIKTSLKKARIRKENDKYAQIKSIIVPLFEQGYGVKKVSEITGISENVLYRCIDEYDISTKMRESKKHLNEIMLPMIACGYKLTEIAKEVGLAPSTVERRIKIRFKMPYRQLQEQLMETYFQNKEHYKLFNRQMNI